MVRRCFLGLGVLEGGFVRVGDAVVESLHSGPGSGSVDNRIQDLRFLVLADGGEVAHSGVVRDVTKTETSAV